MSPDLQAMARCQKERLSKRQRLSCDRRDRRDPISIASSGRGVIRRLRLGHLGLQESGKTWNNIYYSIYYSNLLATFKWWTWPKHAKTNQNESKLYLYKLLMPSQLKTAVTICCGCRCDTAGSQSSSLEAARWPADCQQGTRRNYGSCVQEKLSNDYEGVSVQQLRTTSHSEPAEVHSLCLWPAIVTLEEPR